jgi:hypothetical protein
MAITKIPQHQVLLDGQFIQVEGPNRITSGYSYDEQQRALYFKESQVIFPSFHGHSHIAEDPIPSATCETPGLMAPDDKCKLDALLQTRLGVLGFQGAGFPDDGGWMQGDIILAAGTEFISLERIGNVVRFTVDSPIPLNCACEECTQIYWIQDETDIASIRPPSCGGKLPGVNAYGELKIHLFPETTIADPNNPSATLNNKGKYPSLIFKRYDDTIAPGTAEFEVVLKRNQLNSLQTEIGWAMSPGAGGKVENVWFTGKDADGNLTRFDLSMEPNSNMLGSLLYKGHLISKKMAVIVDYTSSILSTNLYTCREWNVDKNAAVGDPFSAKNVWQYINPENPSTGANPQSLILDASIDLLPIGSLVELWFFKIAEVSGQPILRYYFSKKPTLNPNHVWTWVGQTQFGDVDIAREELPPGAGSEDKTSAEQVSAIREFSQTLWGLTGYDDPLLSYDVASTGGTEEADISLQHRAIIDTDLPGLKVVASTEAPTDFSERPVYLWNRKNLCNAKLRLDIGRPSSSNFTPYDILIRAPIDETTTKYLRVIGKGILKDGSHYVRVCGAHFHDLPQFGALRCLYPYSNQNVIYNYKRKLMFPTSLQETQGTGLGGSDITDFTNPPNLPGGCDTIVLIGGVSNNLPYPGEVGDIVELLHQEYSATIVRAEFSYNESSQVVDVQFKVGHLDMSLPYEEDVLDDVDDFVRGLAPGYAVSGIYSQAGTYSGIGSQPSATPEGFVVYDGGAQIGGSQSEYWNRLEIMVRESQLWIWWNQLLVPPSSVLSASLPTPVNVQTPYFPIDYDPNRSFGKFGARLWPGATVRRMDVRTQISLFSEFSYGQLEVT